MNIVVLNALFINYISVEQENDLLVCGVCQTNFPLQDIIKFIRHKVTRCNKENVDVETSEFEDGEEPDPESLAISSKRTSISAPITRKEQIENRLSPRSPSSESSPTLKDVKLRNENSQSNLSDRDCSIRSPFRTSTNEKSCNTEITGRYYFTSIKKRMIIRHQKNNCNENSGFENADKVFINPLSV